MKRVKIQKHTSSREISNVWSTAHSGVDQRKSMICSKLYKICFDKHIVSKIGQVIIFYNSSPKDNVIPREPPFQYCTHCAKESHGSFLQDTSNIIKWFLSHLYLNEELPTTLLFTNIFFDGLAKLCTHGYIYDELDIISHDDVIKWKHFPHYWPFVWGIHRSTVNSPHKGQWCEALMHALNKRLSKQLGGWWFEMPWRLLLHHCNGSLYPYIHK